MINFITMTPWHYYNMINDRTNYRETLLSRENLDCMYAKHILDTAYLFNKNDVLLGELAKDPIYAEFLGTYKGFDSSNSTPLKISDKGYAFECSEYLTSAFDISPYIKAGLCLIEAEKRGVSYFTGKNLIDQNIIAFLAASDKTYTIYLSAFTGWIYNAWEPVDESLLGRIVLDGVQLSGENLNKQTIHCDFDNQICPEYIDASKEFAANKCNRNSYDFHFDVTASYSGEEFEKLINGNDHAFYGYEIVVHTNTLFKESTSEYPMIYSVAEYKDGSASGEKFLAVKFPKLSELMYDIELHMQEKGYENAVYAMWYSPVLKDFVLDVFEDVILYIEVNVTKRQVHFYDGKCNSGYERFMEIYNRIP